MADVRVVMDNAAIQRMLTSPTGPAMRAATVKAQEVKNHARSEVAVSQGRDFTTRGQPQHLRDTIVTRFVSDAKGPANYVGSDLRRAWWYHQGTVPHVIVPVRAKALRFVSRGTVIFAKRVNHPGTRGNPFLIKAARRAGLRVRTNR